MVVIRNFHQIITGMPCLFWYTDVRFFSLSLVNDVDAIDEDIFQATPEIWCGGQVRQIFLNDTPYI